MLFSARERADKDPIRFAEPHFEYFERSGRGVVQHIRDLIEDWYSRYPDTDKELRGRFHSNDDVNFMSAFFELYIHELLLRLGYSVEPHPHLPNSRKHTDFLARGGDGRDTYIELVLATGESEQEIATRAIKNQVLDSINRMRSPNFFIGVETVGSASTPPPARQWRGALGEWVDKLDPDEVAATVLQYGIDALPKLPLEHEGKTIFICRASPKKIEARNKANVRPIGSIHTGFQFVNNTAAIQSVIERKADYYGALDKPFIIAVNGLTPFPPDDEDLALALIRSDRKIEPHREVEAVWVGPHGPRNGMVSAVLAIKWLEPARVADKDLVLYHNPWAEKPCEGLITRCSQMVAEDGFWVRQNGLHPRELFGLPEGWPEHDDID